MSVELEPDTVSIVRLGGEGFFATFASGKVMFATVYWGAALADTTPAQREQMIEALRAVDRKEGES